MKQEEIINLSEEWLKSVPHLKKHIKLIDEELKNKNCNEVAIRTLQQEKNKHHNKLARIIRAIGTLKDENQRILCYRYFDKLSYSEIARRIGVSSHNTISNRIKYKLLLKVGRIMFGFEDGFFNKISFDD